MSVVIPVGQATQRGVLHTTWTGLDTGDTGFPLTHAGYPMHSVQFGGTFGGATAVLEGSDDGLTYFTLTGESPSGGADVLVSTTGAQRFDISGITPMFIRPRVSGGAAASITVTMDSRSTSR